MRTDIEWKRMQMRWEPWKAMAIAFGAGAALMGTLVGLLTFILTHVR